MKSLLTLTTATLLLSASCWAQEGSILDKPPLFLPPNIVDESAESTGNGIVGRSERENSASQVMNSQLLPAQDNAVLQAMFARDKEQFNETVKRLRKIESSAPDYALAQYRQFLVGRRITPSVGVEVALKVAQMRQKLKDYGGAVVTCDVFAKRFAGTPTSALLQLEKARALETQGQLEKAVLCVHEAMPKLLELGPKYYPEVSGNLIQLADFIRSKPQGNQQAGAIYNDVEWLYFEWLKEDMIPHMWDSFEELRDKYQQVGYQQQADILLPKVAAVPRPAEP